MDREVSLMMSTNSFRAPWHRCKCSCAYDADSRSSGNLAGRARTSAGGHQAPTTVHGRRGSAFGPDGERTAVDDDADDDDSSPERPVHDISYVADYPMRSPRSGRRRDESGVMVPVSNAIGYVLCKKGRLPPGRVLIQTARRHTTLPVA